ncbi:alpha/beta hydrolase [Dongia sedimenti]|uniref:Alpha/beta hydrolase n=1 Tax=Dongia sedimenti TaxID=3064282 RepID=A0ABU0YKD6_9PROT|nr:alpha/beta hydrolase [Rhodospirillaceae bacterium R-7]
MTPGRSRRLVRTVVSCALAGLLAVGILRAAKDPTGLLNALSIGSQGILEADIAYGDLARQHLDLYRPSQSRAVPAPVVVFFYGGAWSSGDRADVRFVGRFLAGEGFVAVIPDYRLRSEAAFPAFLDDGAKALRWVQDHIAEHGGDPQRLFLMGHSAGAYNAIMLALHRHYGAAAGVDAARIRGVVGLAGPYDFKLDTDLWRWVFGAASDLSATQPVRFAASGAPPVLLVTGDRDETVDPENSRSLARRLAAAKSPVRLLELPGLGHADVLWKLSPWYPGRMLREEIVRFLDRPEMAGP